MLGVVLWAWLSLVAWLQGLWSGRLYEKAEEQKIAGPFSALCFLRRIIPSKIEFEAINIYLLIVFLSYTLEELSYTMGLLHKGHSVLCDSRTHLYTHAEWNLLWQVLEETGEKKISTCTWKEERGEIERKATCTQGEVKNSQTDAPRSSKLGSLLWRTNPMSQQKNDIQRGNRRYAHSTPSKCLSRFCFHNRTASSTEPSWFAGWNE